MRVECKRPECWALIQLGSIIFDRCFKSLEKEPVVSGPIRFLVNAVEERLESLLGSHTDWSHVAFLHTFPRIAGAGPHVRARMRMAHGPGSEVIVATSAVEAGVSRSPCAVSKPIFFRVSGPSLQRVNRPGGEFDKLCPPPRSEIENRPGS
jgi:hypothetical protein